MDVATVVFSHVQCVKTRLNLALVSKLWREASKPAAAYPLKFDLDAFPDRPWTTRRDLIIEMLDNDEALSLPNVRVVGLLGEYERVFGFVGARLVTANSVLCEYATLRGSVRLLKWTRENNLDWSAGTCTYAARNGHLPALQYLHENGCPWDSYTCSYAALSGHLPALQYLHENGCPWDWETCSSAAQNGHLPVLKYLHENGCPWDEETCFYAAYNDRWDCLQYAVDNKCDEWETYAEKYARHLR